MIVCCGEALIDMLPRKTGDGEEAYVPFVGGAVFNTAIALGRLGAPTGFFTGMSTDVFGQQLRDALVASTVDPRYIHFADRPTTLAFVKLTNGQASYMFYDENTAGRMLSEADLPDLAPDVAALHFSCISLIPEPCGSTYEALMRREHAGRVMMFDPNIRKDFIPDRKTHLARMKRMLQMADIVKLSDEDLAWFGETGEPAEIARRWLDAGPKLVVITMGAKGIAGFSRNGDVLVEGERVLVKDTVGAGDTVNAGILAYLSDHGLLTKSGIASLSRDQVRGALAFANRAAAVTVSRAGANPPWRDELAS
ncbi:MAG TPA: carbohydrate kinase [Tianweitania sediminis]|nr:carbohydrate kinase [Tianweitania sediminis]